MSTKNIDKDYILLFIWKLICLNKEKPQNVPDCAWTARLKLFEVLRWAVFCQQSSEKPRLQNLK